MDIAHPSAWILLFAAITWAAIAIDIILFIKLRRNPLQIEKLGTSIRSLPWRTEDAFALLVVFFATQLINLSAAVSAFQMGWLTEKQTNMLQLLLQVVTVPAICLICLALIMHSRGVSFKQWLNTSPQALARHLRLAIICYLALLPIFAAVQLVNVPVLEFFKIPVEQQGVIDVLLSHDYPSWLRGLLMILAVTAAPIVEELIFRGIALPALMKRMGTLQAICVVSLVFAIIHFHVPSIAPLFVVAFAFSLGYLYSETLLVPIAMHAMFNGVNLAALFLLKDMPGLTN